MKKLISLILCAVMILGLAACGSGTTPSTTNPPATNNNTPTNSDTPASTEPAPAEPGKYEVTEPITIEFWSSYGDEIKQAWLQDAVDAFNASQDMITVEMKTNTGYTAMNEQLTAAQAAGKGLPALAFINCPRVLTYAVSGMTEPLNDYMEAFGFELDDFNTGMMAAMTPDGSDQYYGLPWGISSSVAYWNVSMLKECGIEKIPETWDEMRDAAKIIKEKKGLKTLGFLSELNYVEVLTRNAGADPLGDGHTADMFNEDVVSFMKELKEMIDAGEAEMFVGTDQDTNLGAAFYSGQLACMIQTSSIANNVSRNSDFEVDSAFGIQYKADPCISCVAGGAIIVPAMNDQQVKNAAFQFIMYMTSKENVASWSVISSSYPTRLSVMQDEAFLKEAYEYEPMLEGIYAGLDGVVPKNKTPYQTAAYKVLLDAMGQYFYDGADFDAVWSAAEDEINLILAGG